MFFSTFQLFDLFLEGQNYRFYWIYGMFSTFRLFNLMMGGQNDQIYWIYWNFSTIRPLAGRSKWLILLNILFFFDFSASCWEVNGAILLDILSFSDFSNFRPPARRSKWLILLTILIFFRFFVILTSWWEIKMIDSTEYIEFFDVSTFRTRGGGQNDQFYLIYLFF